MPGNYWKVINMSVLYLGRQNKKQQIAIGAIVEVHVLVVTIDFFLQDRRANMNLKREKR